MMKIIRFGQKINMNYIYKYIKSYLRDFIFINFPKIIESDEYWVDNKFKIVYLVTSKCACTSIKKFMYKGYYKNNFKGNNIHKSFPVKFKFRKNNINLDDYKDYYIFTVVRDPDDRLISTYNNKFNVPYEDFEFLNYYRNIFDPQDSFEVFLKKIKTIEPKFMDRHFVPLSYKIKSSNFKGDIFNIKDLNLIFNILASKYGLPNKIEVANKSFPGSSSQKQLVIEFLKNNDDYLNDFGLENV